MKRELIAYVALVWASVLCIWTFTLLVKYGGIYISYDGHNPFELAWSCIFLLMGVEGIIRWLRKNWTRKHDV